MVGFFRILLKGVPGEAYNIGNPNPEVSMNTLADTFKRMSPGVVTIQTTEYPDSYPADEPRRRCPNISKAELQLGFRPNVRLEDGVERFLSWSIPRYRSELADIS
jgi:UDP-glucuronate decarboxylase